MAAMRMTVPEAEQIRILGEKYSMSETEVKKWQEEGVRFLDLDKGSLYAWIAEKPLAEVLALRKDRPWGRVALTLGLTAESMHDGECRWRAWCLRRWWGYDESRSYEALKAGYPMHWVKLAWLIAAHSTLAMEDVLARRPRSVAWWDWAEKEAGIPAGEMKALVKSHRNPGLPKKE